MLSENGLSSLLFFLCLLVPVNSWTPTPVPQVKKITVRPEEGTHSPFTAAYTSSTQMYLHRLALALICWLLPHPAFTHRGNHFLFRKAHNHEDPFF